MIRIQFRTRGESLRFWCLAHNHTPPPTFPALTVNRQLCFQLSSSSPRRENHPSVPGPISQLTPSWVQGSISQPALRTEEAPAEIITNEFVKSDDSSIKSGNNCSDSQLPNLELLSESSSRESELDGSSSSLKNIERV